MILFSFYPTSPVTTVQEIAQWGNLHLVIISKDSSLKLCIFQFPCSEYFIHFIYGRVKKVQLRSAGLFFLHGFSKAGGNPGSEKPCL